MLTGQRESTVYNSQNEFNSSVLNPEQGVRDLQDRAEDQLDQIKKEHCIIQGLIASL